MNLGYSIHLKIIFHHLGYGNLIVDFLEMFMVLKEILQAKNVANE